MSAGSAGPLSLAPVDLSAGGNGGAAARRAVLRWSWRLFRREWRQQVLVLALLTAAVAATVLGAAIGTNAPPPLAAGYGSADHLALVTATPQRARDDVAALRQRFGAVDVIQERQLRTGTAEGAMLRAQDPAGRYGGPMVALRSGRFPAGAGEVAMTSSLARSYGLQPGDEWTDDGAPRRLVGIVENPQNLLDDFALVAPGQVDRPDRTRVLFDATDDAVAAYRPPPGVSVQAPSPPALSPAYVVLALAIFGLVFVGLVAVAGFSVLAQRRLRALGMLSSLGATDRAVRLVMIANGALVGTVGALTGGVLGLVLWAGYAPRFSQHVHHRVAWAHLPWWLVALAMLLAVGTSVLAAGRPARSVSRLPVMAALSGRPAHGRPARRTVVPGAVVLLAGLVMIWCSGGWSGGNDALQLGGLLAAAVGVLLLAPGGVAILAAVAARTPVASRLALRDLSRYRTRSGVALAAVSFAVFTAVIVVLLSTGRLADPVDYAGPNLPADQLLIRPDPGSETGLGAPAGPDGAAGPADPGRAGRDERPGATPPRRDPATDAASVRAISGVLGASDPLPLLDSGPTLGQGLRGDPGTIWLATPQVLAHYGIDPATIAPDTILLTSRHGLAGASGLVLFAGPDRPPYQNPKVQRTGALPTGASQPNLLLTEYGARLLQLSPVPAGWLVQTPHPLIDGQINTVRQLALADHLTIETRSGAASAGQLRTVATGGGILLALGVLAMTIGLIRGEAGRDLRTLAATGASSWVRRRITAATAAGLGLVGALWGTVAGYLVAIALFHQEFSQRLGDVPLPELAATLVGLPLAATVGSWLLAGREPPVIVRRAVE
ncbi:FtsX-like permease family protein [Plantactinospora siamensis]|uniref:FtsX-like permease family protein n=1 Tax=Plantactinospora siamensis TaxID=555372 RepID=A0ABV6NXI6_9ACTN